MSSLFPAEITIRVIFDASSIKDVLSMLLAGVTPAPAPRQVSAVSEADAVPHDAGADAAFNQIIATANETADAKQKRGRGRPRNDAAVTPPTIAPAAPVAVPAAAPVAGPDMPAAIPAELMPAAAPAVTAPVAPVAAPAAAPVLTDADRLSLRSAVIRYVQKPGVGVNGWKALVAQALPASHATFNPATSPAAEVATAIAALRAADPACFA